MCITYIVTRLLLDTFDKFMRRDVHIRYKYLTRMASIIYQARHSLMKLNNNNI